MGNRYGSAAEYPLLPATPGRNPVSGSALLYFKADGNLYRKDNSGIETALTAVAGSSTPSIDWVKASVKAASTTNLAALSGTVILDGVQTAVGDRVLVKNQATASANGIYVVAAGTWARSSDANTATLLAEAQTAVLQGTQAGIWQTTFKATDTLGTTNMVWVQGVSVPSGGTALQYLRGDNTWQTLNLAALPDAWVKRSVRVASTANVVIATGGLQTVDGVTTAANDRVLLKNQTTASENGIYQVNAGAWTRASDANTSAMMAGADVAVDSGTQGGFLYSNLFKVTDILGTTNMNWYRVVDQSMVGAVGGVEPTLPANGLTTQWLRGDRTWTGLDLGSLGQSLTPLKLPVLVTTTGNVGLTGSSVTNFDGGFANGARVLVKDQTNPAENGIYIVNNAGAWSRSSDAATATVLAGATVVVQQGTLYGGTTWTTNLKYTDTLGTAPCRWAQDYSDLNPPKTLDRTVYPSTSVSTPAAGLTREFTQDGRGLWEKTSDGVTHKVGHMTVKAATTAAITLSAPQTIDGIALVAGDFCLVKDQTTPASNGVYVVGATATAWTRAPGFDTAQGIGESGLVTVQGGTLWGGTMWETDFKATDTLDTSGMAWAMVNNPLFVKAATATNFATFPPLGPQTVDGIACNAGDRVLVKMQGAGAGTTSQNGVWVVGATGVAWTRSPDSDTIGKMLNQTVVVQQGTMFGGETFRLAMQQTDTLGTTPVLYGADRVESVGYLVYPTPTGNGHTVFDYNRQMLATYDAGANAWRFSGVAQVSATAPANLVSGPPPVVGWQWYDTTAKVLKVWDGAVWQPAGGADTGWVNYTAGTGTVMFNASTGVTISRYRVLNGWCTVALTRTVVTAQNNTVADYTNSGATAAGAVPAAACPTGDTIVQMGRIADVPVVCTLTPTGLIQVNGGGVASYTAGQAFNVQFVFPIG